LLSIKKKLGVISKTGATGSLKDRLDDLKVIHHGGAVDESFLHELLENNAVLMRYGLKNSEPYFVISSANIIGLFWCTGNYFRSACRIKSLPSYGGRVARKPGRCDGVL
jgi:hypothetical protein